MTAVSQ